MYKKIITLFLAEKPVKEFFSVWLLHPPYIGFTVRGGKGGSGPSLPPPLKIFDPYGFII